MAVRTPSLRVLRHESEHDRWELVIGEPHPGLRRHVARYCGYEEVTRSFARRLEPPGVRVPLIVNLGPSLAVRTAGDGAWHDHEHGFVAGLHDTYAVTDSGGKQAGVQVDLTPVGARLTLGLPMRDVSGRVVPLQGAFGAAGLRLRDRLLEAPGWERRFAIMDAFLLERIDGGAPPPASLARALERLHASRGAVDIGALTAELGCSRRHLIALFNEHVGVPPKRFARILRFERTLELARSRAGGGWAEIAQTCGYYDQAHMIRDFRQFTGHSPSGYERLTQPAGARMTGD